MTDEAQHVKRIVDQFSQQAIPFARLASHLEAMEWLVKWSGVDGRDHVLDVACGPGLVACEFARHAAQVSGIDLTEAMIEQARKRQGEMGLENLEWHVGNAAPLLFEDGSFSLVITRYSFHHFLAPGAALKEMIRVCRPGGRVMVADVMVVPERSAAYDRMEKLRDPSHAHALTEPEFVALFNGSGLRDCRRARYQIHSELEAQLQASFPEPGDAEKLRRMITEDIGVNALGIDARREEERVVFDYPIGVFLGCKR